MDRVEVEDMGVVMFQFITMIAYSKACCGGLLGAKRFASNETRLVLRVGTLGSGCSMSFGVW